MQFPFPQYLYFQSIIHNFTISSHKMAAKTILNPRTFPRPPLLEKISRRLQIKWGDGDEEMLIADTGEDGEESKAAYWVLETWHPPSKSHLFPYFKS